MLNNKNAMTVCVDVEHNLDIQRVIIEHVKTIGCVDVYMDGDKVYVGFETKSTVTDVAKVLKNKLNKSEVKIVGGTLFVK